MNEFVYFAQAENGTVKIGYSATPRERIAALNSGNIMPVKELAIICGDRGVESRLHREFSSDRVNGEWFAPSDRLFSCIENLRSQACFEPDMRVLKVRRWLMAFGRSAAAEPAVPRRVGMAQIAAQTGVSEETLERILFWRAETVGDEDFEAIRLAYVEHMTALAEDIWRYLALHTGYDVRSTLRRLDDAIADAEEAWIPEMVRGAERGGVK